MFLVVLSFNLDVQTWTAKTLFQKLLPSAFQPHFGLQHSPEVDFHNLSTSIALALLARIPLSGAAFTCLPRSMRMKWLGLSNLRDCVTLWTGGGTLQLGIPSKRDGAWLTFRNIWWQQMSPPSLTMWHFYRGTQITILIRYFWSPAGKMLTWQHASFPFLSSLVN